MNRRQRFQLLLIPTALVVVFLLFEVSQNRKSIQDTLSYATRPLWDVADGPQEVLTHFYAEGMELDGNACQLHGWKERQGKKDVKVIDAILMSSELDLLEVRMNELDTVVDRFFILESNATFTGMPKELFFSKNRKRFEKFKNKIEYYYLPGYSLGPNETPWTREARTRDTMTRSIRSHIHEFTPTAKPMVIMSDVDEIPAWHTIELLKSCDFGASIHLQMRNYLYSFEWFLGMTSWRASVTMWNKETFYRHSQHSNVALADSGWHCSFCFRTIEEYALKMQGYSHSDRLNGRLDLLDPKRIQDVICKGKDIFGMLPEAYSYGSLLSQMNPEPQKSAVGVPWFALANPDYFKFLLPSGCIRASEKEDSKESIEGKDHHS